MALAALAALGTCLTTPAEAQISPGPLASVHADLDGSRDCLTCHAKGQGVDPNLCLSCHEILGQRIEAGHGLHSKAGYQDCRICHIDHHGRDYELVWWGDAGMDAFDHRLTGETLTGAHKDLACRDCHKADFIEAQDRFRQADKDFSRTLLGLSPDCASCHHDQHRGQFEASTCTECHTTEAWKPATGFDHSQTSFALTGAHERTSCTECHQEETDDRGAFERFTPVPHQQCGACHRDPHEGALGADCQSCHATESWFATPGFDHAKTRYPLTGRHRRVACRDCHRPDAGDLQFQDLAFAECSDCHSDPHEARLGPECSSCHSTADWSGIVEGRFDHAGTRFALEGAHARVECAGCHAEGEPLRIAGFEACATCHADEHLGQFARREDEGACESCHSLESFKPTLFTEEDHQASRYPLEGLHRGVACTECHAKTTFRPRAGGQAVQAAKFRYESLQCTECHEDPHAGTTDPWLADGGCQTCHSDAGWKVPVFDHSTTPFALAGAHAPLECTACHGVQPGAEDERRLLLTDTPTECADCHQEPHGGQFATRQGGCASCHTDIAWANLLFDHNRDSTYLLDGAHALAPCTSCHLPVPGTQQELDPTRPVVRYVPLAAGCEDCHTESQR